MLFDLSRARVESFTIAFAACGIGLLCVAIAGVFGTRFWLEECADAEGLWYTVVPLPWGLATLAVAIRGRRSESRTPASVGFAASISLLLLSHFALSFINNAADDTCTAATGPLFPWFFVVGALLCAVVALIAAGITVWQKDVSREP